MSETGPGSGEFEYVRPPRPRHFPVEAEVPESQRHLELRTALYQLLSFFLRGRATVGSDQFVYFDASDPKACLAPDVFLQLGTPGPEIVSWKTWERGPIDLAIEIGSRSDAPEEPWQAKLTRYHRLGVCELVRFDASAVNQLRIWDYVDGDLVERKLAQGATARCRVLGMWWVIVPHAAWGPGLRLAHDAEGQQLVLSETETAMAAHQAEAEARRVAEAQVRDLQAELLRLRERES